MHTTLKTTMMAAVLATAAPAGLSAQGTIPEGITPGTRTVPTRQGTRGANFLELGVGARGQAMAGAVVSHTDDPTAFYWNPAGAANLEQFTFAATRQNLYDGLDITHDYFAAALPFMGGVLGAHVTALSSGEIERTTEDAPTGGDPQFGPTFEWSGTSIGASYARRITDRLDIAGTLKFVGEGISDARISWVAGDVGTQFRTGIYGLTIGATIQNVGPSSRMRGSVLRRKIESEDLTPQRTDVSFTTRELELPTLFRFSVGTDLLGSPESVLGQGGGRHRLLGELATSDAIDTDLQVAGGLEYSLANMFFLRAGKRFYNDDRATGENTFFYGLAGGAGLRVPFRERAVRFDYAYISMGDLENVQVFSFEFGR